MTAKTRREAGQRRLPSGKWQVYVRIKGPGDAKPRFISTTFPADSDVTEGRTWRERVRIEVQLGSALTPPHDAASMYCKRRVVLEPNANSVRVSVFRPVLSTQACCRSLGSEQGMSSCSCDGYRRMSRAIHAGQVLARRWSRCA